MGVFLRKRIRVGAPTAEVGRGTAIAERERVPVERAGARLLGPLGGAVVLAPGGEEADVEALGGTTAETGLWETRRVLGAEGPAGKLASLSCKSSEEQLSLELEATPAAAACMVKSSSSICASSSTAPGSAAGLRRSISVSHHSSSGKSALPLSLVLGGLGFPSCAALSTRSIHSITSRRTAAALGCGLSTSWAVRRTSFTRRASVNFGVKRLRTSWQGSCPSQEGVYVHSSVTFAAARKHTSTSRPAAAQACGRSKLPEK